MVLQAVKTNAGEFPRQGLVDAGYRSEDNFERLAGLPMEPGRSGARVSSTRKSMRAPVRAHGDGRQAAA